MGSPHATDERVLTSTKPIRHPDSHYVQFCPALGWPPIALQHLATLLLQIFGRRCLAQCTGIIVGCHAICEVRRTPNLYPLLREGAVTELVCHLAITVNDKTGTARVMDQNASGESNTNGYCWECDFV